MTMIGANRGTRIRTCPSAILSITNPTRTGLGSKRARRGERLATAV